MGRTVEDYKDVFGNWRKNYSENNNSGHTASAVKWLSMNYRCKVGGAYQKTRPSYVGCKTSINFKDFQFFTDWHREQVGYGFFGYQLDKDILKHGNKLYSEDTCVLIPQSLNSFTTNFAAPRGKFKKGVHWDENIRAFKAQIRISNKYTYLGMFKTEEGAYEVYKAAKKAESYRWYERLKAGEFIVDERVIERMRTWTLEDEA